MTTAGFFDLATTDPDRRALVDPDEHAWSYGDLGALANRLARGIERLGVRPGDTVAAVMSNSAELVALYAAAVQSGLWFVALNWHLGADEIRYILEDSQARLVVASPAHLAVTEEAAGLAGVDHVFTTGGTSGARALAELAEGMSPAPLPERRPGQIMFYTSGTTGRPKGVRKRFAPVPPDEVDLSTGIGIHGSPALQIDGTDAVTLVSGPLYHAAPIAAVTTGLDTGGTVVIVDRWTPEGFLDLVARYRVTNASMVPTMFHRLLALPEDVRRQADTSSLRSVMHAGAPCSVDLKRRMIEWWGPIINEAYSSTEGAGTFITAEEWLRKPGSVGRPSAGVTLKILDDDGDECPPGEPGLVYLSPTLWEFEYHNDPGKTAATRQAGLFTVGDIGYVDDEGYLFLCDRQADVIISGGVNIYPAEVEGVLLAHEKVSDAVVIGVPDDEWGESVLAVVQPAPGLTADAALERELVEHCRDRLAHFKCPRRIDFVDELGRDPNGKVRKGAIRARYWADRDRRI